MTLDTDTTAPISETPAPAPAPAPEAKAPEPTPDVLKDDLNDAERLDAAEDAELRNAFRKAEAARKQDAPAEEPEESAAKRDPKTGKFVSPLKEEVTTEDEPEAKAPKAEKADEKPAAKPEEAKKPAVEAPKHWSDKQKAALSKLDPEEAEAFIKEATEARQHLSRQGNALKAYEPIGRVIQENKALFDRAGVSPDQGIAALLRAQAQLSDPNTAHAALMKIAQDFNIDLGTQAASEDQEYIDPDVLQLRNELEETRRVARESQETLQRMLAEQRTQSAEGLVNQFFQAQGEEIDDATADHVALRVKMLTSVYPNVHPQQILARAWEEVRALDPSRQEKMVAEKLRDQQAKVEQARRAAALAVQSEPDPLSASSEDELLRRAFRKGRAA